jgi:hypothetical protein
MGSFKCSTFNSLIPNIRQSVSTHFVRNVVVQIRLEHQSILRWKRPFLAPPFFSWLEGIHKHCMTKNHKHWYWISIQYIVIRYIYIFLRSPPKNPTVSLVSPPASSRRTKPWRSWKIPRCTNNKNRNSRSKNSNNGVVYWLILMYYIILPWL